MTSISKILPTGAPAAVPFAIRAERADDLAAREALLDACFGPNRHLRTCQRLRDGRTPAAGLAFSAIQDGRIIGTLRLWNADAGGVPALVLGPLAIEAESRSLGIGAALVHHAIDAARALGYRAILLLGDAPYYARFGFSADKAESLALPGPFERERLLGLELTPGALSGANGMIVATSARSAIPRRSNLSRAA